MTEEETTAETIRRRAYFIMGYMTARADDAPQGKLALEQLDRLHYLAAMILEDRVFNPLCLFSFAQDYLDFRAACAARLIQKGLPVNIQDPEHNPARN